MRQPWFGMVFIQSQPLPLVVYTVQRLPLRIQEWLLSMTRPNCRIFWLSKSRLFSKQSIMHGTPPTHLAPSTMNSQVLNRQPLRTATGHILLTLRHVAKEPVEVHKLGTQCLMLAETNTAWRRERTSLKHWWSSLTLTMLMQVCPLSLDC